MISGKEHFAFEMAPTDPLPANGAERVLEAFNKFQANFSIGKLRFRPTSHQQLENISNQGHPMHGVPLMSTDELWAAIKYLPIFRETAFGKIKLLPNVSSELLDTLTVGDIAVFTSGIPNEIPPVAAVVVFEPLPPLCHVSLLCVNRKTPCAYISKSYLKEFQAMDGKLARLELLPKHFKFEAARSDLGRKHYSRPGSGTLVKPQMDPRNLMPLENVPEGKSIPAGVAGAKAAQCAQLNRALAKQSHAQEHFHKSSFVLPMGSYLEHVNDSSISGKLSRFLVKWKDVHGRVPSPGMNCSDRILFV